MNKELKYLTTLGIGGPAKEIVYANSVEELVNILEKTKKENIPFMVLGGGSNTLFMDKGFDGKIIVYKKGRAYWEENNLIVEAGISLGEMVSITIKYGKGGYEKLIGIPGTVGGALWNNAGAYGQTISDYLISVDVWHPKKGLCTYSKSEMQFGYRTSILHDDKEGIALRAVFSGFYNEKSENLKDAAREVLETRNEKLPPPGWKTCGSFFQNMDYSSVPPQRVHAGKLLEQIGGKTIRVGDAGMYEKHANILVNYGNASASDVIKLRDLLIEKTKSQFGVILKPEIKIVPFQF